MKQPETAILESLLKDIYNGKTPKKVKRLVEEFDMSILASRKVLKLYKLETEKSRYVIADDRGHVLNGLISIYEKDYSPEDVGVLCIEVAVDSASIEGLKV